MRQLGTQSEIEILPPDAGSFHGITFSPDGNHLYFVRTDKNDYYFKNLYRMPTLGGMPQKLTTDVDSPVSFLPDGQEMVYEHNDLSRSEIELIVAKADGSSARVLTTFHNANGYMYDPGPGWSPDGKVIALPVMLLERPFRWVIETVSVSNGRALELYSSQEDMGRPGWLPKGDTILFALNDSNLRSKQLWALSLSRRRCETAYQRYG